MKKNVKRILTLMMCVCMMASIVPVQASADSQPIKDGVYEILTALDTNMALETQNVTLFYRNYTPTQRWKFVYDSSDGCYTITNVGTGWVLDVQGGTSAKAGANVHQYPLHGNANQKWVIKKESDGNYSISPKFNKNLRLDVANAKTAAYTNVQVWKNNNSKAQRFQLVNCQNVKGGKCEIESNLYYGYYVLDIQNSSKNGCATVLLSKSKNTRSSSHSQIFDIQYDPSDGYYVIYNTNSGMVVDVRGGTSAKSGNDVHQYPYHGQANQKWFFYDEGDGNYSIRSKVNPNLALDVAGGKAEEGANVQISWGRGAKSTLFNLDFDYVLHSFKRCESY